jgi:hypothetical protein
MGVHRSKRLVERSRRDIVIAVSIALPGPLPLPEGTKVTPPLPSEQRPSSFTTTLIAFDPVLA